MAREFATIRCAIWGDEDWRALSGPAQHLYFTMLTQGSLSFCGVGDYYPKRLAALTQTHTAATIEDAAAELEDASYVVVDRDTDEVFVRSFVRWDGLLRKPNVAIAMAKNYHGIVSLRIRRAFIRELLRLHADEGFRDCRAWGAPKVQELLSEPSDEPLTNPFPKGSPNPSGKECLTTATATSTATTTATLLASEAPPSDDRPDVTRLCEHLAYLIEGNGSKRPAITAKWRDAARLLLDRDHRDEQEAHRLLEWCQADNFWHANILSLPTFREKYDALRLQAQRPERAITSTAGGSARKQEGDRILRADMEAALAAERNAS